MTLERAQRIINLLQALAVALLTLWQVWDALQGPA